MRKPLFVATSDEHIDDKTPVNRKDDYLEASAKKLQFITEKANELGVPWLSGGDIFHRAIPKPSAISTALQNIQPTKGFYAIPGNHDLKFHNYDLIKETGIYTLEKAGKKILKPYEVVELDDMLIVGMPWEHYDVPAGIFDNYPKEKIRVGLIHIMTYPKGKVPYVGCSASNTEELANRLSMFDVVISGDNHQRFELDNGNTLWINCGSLMRMNVGQADYQPKLHIVYNDLTWEAIDIPVGNGVLNLIDKEEEKERNEQLEQYVNKLVEQDEVKMSFEDNMKAYVDANRISKEVNEEINKAIGE